MQGKGKLCVQKRERHSLFCFPCVQMEHMSFNRTPGKFINSGRRLNAAFGLHLCLCEETNPMLREQTNKALHEASASFTSENFPV